MVDNVDKPTRSRMMAGIAGKNTKPELLIRKALHAKGYRYRLHAMELPGKPDIILPKYRSVILINGCFWHGHDCHLFKMPSTRPEFWKVKINRNRQRDQEVKIQNTKNGWRVLTIWECTLKGKTRLDLDTIVQEVERWLQCVQPVGEITGARND